MAPNAGEVGDAEVAVWGEEAPPHAVLPVCVIEVPNTPQSDSA